MPSPTHHVAGVEHSQSAQEASMLAENIRYQLMMAGCERGRHDQDSVIRTSGEPTPDGDLPKPPGLFAGHSTIRSYSIIAESHSRRVGFRKNILERCSWCKKKLPENADLYMYGFDLGVYCSVECRKKQMTLDGCHIEDNVHQRNGRLPKF